MSVRLLGLIVALASLVLDQANKLWLVYSFDIAARQPVRLLPFFDIVYARNPGISYSLFSAHGPFGRWLLVALTLLAILALSFWLWRMTSRLAGVALGLVIGGALGNAADRITYGAVADFYYFHIGSFSWYVFNLADVAIVLGVALLVLESFRAEPSMPVEEGRPS